MSQVLSQASFSPPQDSKTKGKTYHAQNLLIPIVHNKCNMTLILFPTPIIQYFKSVSTINVQDLFKLIQLQSGLWVQSCGERVRILWIRVIIGSKSNNGSDCHRQFWVQTWGGGLLHTQLLRTNSTSYEIRSEFPPRLGNPPTQQKAGAISVQTKPCRSDRGYFLPLLHDTNLWNSNKQCGITSTSSC